MTTDDPDDFFRPPNDNAYESDELRTGPPLDYVAEKFRSCLEGLHGTIHEIEQHSETESTATDANQDDLVGFHAKYAFQSAIVGYLALNNMLALANDNDLSNRLSSYSREEFKDWLDRIDQSGSVTG